MYKLKTIVKLKNELRDYKEENQILLSEKRANEILLRSKNNQIEKLKNEIYIKDIKIKRYEETINGLRHEFLETNNNNSLINLQNRLKTFIGGIKYED